MLNAAYLGVRRKMVGVFPLHEIIFPIIWLVSLLVLLLFSVSVVRKGAASGPGAIGRALGFLVLFESLGTYVLWYTVRMASLISSTEIPENYRLYGFLVFFLAIPLLAGILAAYTVETTRAMNTKIILALGWVPHGIATSVYFEGGVYGATAFWGYFVAAVLGGVLGGVVARGVQQVAVR